MGILPHATMSVYQCQVSINDSAIIAFLAFNVLSLAPFLISLTIMVLGIEHDVAKVEKHRRKK